MNTMKWLLKRELWEHKGAFLWTPMLVGFLGLLLVTVMLLSAQDGAHVSSENGVTSWHFGNQPEATAPANVKHATRREVINGLVPGVILIAPTVIAFAACFAIFFYACGTLYEERKNRSVLFWKSLPLTDGQTVVSKALVAIVLAPLLAVALAIVFNLISMGICVIAQLWAGYLDLPAIFGNPDSFRLPIKLLGALPVYFLWAMPTVGLLLMVSALAKGNPLLWILAIPLGTGFVLYTLNSMFRFWDDMDWYWQFTVGRGLLSIVPFSWFKLNTTDVWAVANSQWASMGQGTTPNPNFSMLGLTWQQLATPNLWVGVAAGAAMIYAAARIRRWKDEG